MESKGYLKAKINKRDGYILYLERKIDRIRKMNKSLPQSLTKAEIDYECIVEPQNRILYCGFYNGLVD